MQKKLSVILDYQENFTDNFSTIAYAKILENIENVKCFYKNADCDRGDFEKKLQNFSVDFDFVSSKKASDIVSTSYFLNRLFLKNKKLFDKCVKNNVISKKNFDVDDEIFLDDTILSNFKFKNTDFIKNFDILDNILTQNSIGLYISNKDKLNSKDYKFIQNSIERLNKYIKNPKLFIFTANENFKLETFVDYFVINLFSWKEEYYFLSRCKHHIVLNKSNSFSLNFWASVVHNREYSYRVLDKNTKINKKIAHNILLV